MPVHPARAFLKEPTFAGPQALHCQPPTAERASAAAQTAAAGPRQIQQEVIPLSVSAAAKAKSGAARGGTAAS